MTNAYLVEYKKNEEETENEEEKKALKKGEKINCKNFKNIIQFIYVFIRISQRKCKKFRGGPN